LLALSGSWTEVKERRSSPVCDIIYRETGSGVVPARKNAAQA
jgi:hypothetical protein